MTPDTADLFRYVYGILAFVCTMAFTTTLIVRWPEWKIFDKVLRIGLLLEHLTLTYASYVALNAENAPVSYVGAMLSCSMLVIVFAFLLWLVDTVGASLREDRKPSDA